MPKIKLTVLTQLLLIISVQTALTCGAFYQIPQSEVDELNIFYEATGGNNWHNNEGWTNLSALVSSSFTPLGITFGNLEIISSNESATFYSANVTEIDLSRKTREVTFPTGNNLRGEIPNLKLPKLKALKLGSNELSGEIPEFNLPNLENLSLPNNNFTGGIPELNLDKLEYFSASNNQLTGTISNIKLPNLKYLILYRNSLTGEIPNFDMPKLEQLNLGNNKLTGEIPNFDMPNLISLSLGQNELTGLVPNFDLPKLEHLTLLYNQLSGSIPNFNLPNLTSLSLSFNELTGLVPNFNLPNLIGLYLESNNLTGEIPSFNFPELNALYLENNELTGTIPSFNFPDLKYLHLGNNQLTGEVPDFDLPNLEFLILDSNQFTGEIPDFNLPKLTRLNLQNNLLSGEVPDFDMPKLFKLRLFENQFTFGELEVNINKASLYVYAPQDTILPIEQNDDELVVNVDGSANKYHWFLGEQKLGTTDENAFTPLEDGIYKCKVTNDLLPDLTLSSHTISVTISGIAIESEDRYFSYLYTSPPYPQPANQQVRVPIYWRLGNAVSPDNIKIYNAMGVNIDHIVAQENRITITESSSINGEIIWDASGMEAGVYFLEIRHGTSTRYVKIMLE